MGDNKRAQIISLIRDTIRASEPTAQIILYGSRARGDAREDSDWDVLVLIDRDKTNFDDYKRICYPVYYKGLDFGQEINPTLYTKKEWEQAHCYKCNGTGLMDDPTGDNHSSLDAPSDFMDIYGKAQKLRIKQNQKNNSSRQNR